MRVSPSSTAPFRFGCALALATFVVSLPAEQARAESGEFNLHVDLGPGFPVAGPLGPNNRLGNAVSVGLMSNVQFDWQIIAPLALEAQVGGIAVFDPYLPGYGDVTPYFNLQVGVRVRPLDNREGYLANGGDVLGNFWVAAHLGFHVFDGPQFGFDVAAGYEFSLFDPVQLGAFARLIVLVEGDYGAGTPGAVDAGLDAIFVLGINGSFELGGQVDALDRDGDGLSDEREMNEHGTNPRNPDTDSDHLQDGIEVNGPTDPNNPDTDGDGALDGVEDANRDGVTDANEADPTIPDTDSGGVPDGFELENSMNPRDPADDDADNDGVLQNVDACPDTAEGAEVDERGCVIIRERMVLSGVQFGYDSADILPASEPVLQIAVQALRDNPDVRVEIGGHTDNQGGRSYNRDLSQRRAEAVRDYLVAHGIDTGRMTVRGYGFSRPVASNDTPEGQAQNRRIEFNVIQPD